MNKRFVGEAEGEGFDPREPVTSNGFRDHHEYAGLQGLYSPCASCAPASGNGCRVPEPRRGWLRRLQLLLQPLQAVRKLLPRVSPHERGEQDPGPVPLEVELC